VLLECSYELIFREGHLDGDLRVFRVLKHSPSVAKDRMEWTSVRASDVHNVDVTPP